MNRRHLMLAATVAAALSAPTSLRAETYLTGAEINERGARFTLAPFGEMRISGISLGGRKSNDCLVQVEGMKRTISGAIKTRTLAYSKGSGRGITITIDMQRVLDQCKHPQTGDFTPCCLGSGEGCRATVEVPDEASIRIMNALGI
ncbi:hypothetical protein [Mesorhizobium sp. CAU 1741]|uniref:hypothetical protein n=1 Tax=Mesorhizobium sp. CAU 1741 TaxID=3140366 RepID=UPI00325B94BC